jgi:AraC-like DNA-binding protein
VSYEERLVGPGPVVCTWEQEVEADREQLVVPDACVDLLWSGTELSVAGPDTHGRTVSLPRGTHVVGVRFAPGSAGAIFGMPASELRDEQPLLSDVFSRDTVARLEEILDDGRDPHALLLQAVRPAVKPPDPLVVAAISALDQPRARVSAVARDIGLSDRQLQRRISDAVGYGPKMLARVLRFRRLQKLPDGVPLVERALDAGYADQAHMTADVTRLTGLSPVRFLKERTPTAA